MLGWIKRARMCRSASKRARSSAVSRPIVRSFTATVSSKGPSARSAR